MVTECKNDCEYYSNYTDTCDYTLLMYESRGCPVDACTRYKPREHGRRSWSAFRQTPCGSDGGGNSWKTADAEPVSEPGTALCVTAACGHEVYDGELVFEGDDGSTLCPECLEERFSALSTAEKAALIGCEFSPVRFPRRTI